jgi:hypothetical protein
MAKQDVLDAINSTIVQNDIKAITAQSLNNVLTMMVENAGEGGSGDGALRVIVPELIAFGGEIVGDGELSPSSWAAMRPELEASLGLDLSEYEEVVNASFAHNANVAQQLIEKAKAGQGVSVVLDQTPYYPATLRMELQLIPEMADIYEECAISVVQPAGLFMQYIDYTPEGEATMGSDEFGCVLAPAGNMNLDGMNATYPSNMLIVLNLDGSLLFEVIEEEQPSSGSGVITFYTTPSGEITEEQKEKNVLAFSKYAAGIPVSVIVNMEGQEAIYYPFTTAYQENKDGASELSFIACGFPIKMANGDFAAMIFYEDGSVEMQMV